LSGPKGDYRDGGFWSSPQSANEYERVQLNLDKMDK
jgi:hypothetical protein